MESYVERETYNESYNKHYLLNNIIGEKKSHQIWPDPSCIASLFLRLSWNVLFLILENKRKAFSKEVQN